jgi:hypothetical protein
METALTTQPNQGVTLTVENIKANIQLIQKVMRSVMKDGVHYGKIPGVDKKSLFKPGAELLGATFRIAPSYVIEDMSTSDYTRYRVKCLGTHQSTGIVLGEGMGEASSNEEKYKWRGIVCDQEFDETDADRRRAKWKRGNNGPYQQFQVRTEPADISNTVLKMACKRAQVAMTINVTACSDIFAQDLEDLPTEIIGQDGGDQGDPPSRQTKPATQTPRGSYGGNGNGSGGGGGGRATEKQTKLVFARLDAAGIPENELLKRYSINHLNELPFAKVDDALAWIAQSNAA